MSDIYRTGAVMRTKTDDRELFGLACKAVREGVEAIQNVEDDEEAFVRMADAVLQGMRLIEQNALYRMYNDLNGIVPVDPSIDPKDCLQCKRSGHGLCYAHHEFERERILGLSNRDDDSG